MQQIYIVKDEALFYNSSYSENIAVVSSLESAEAVVETYAADFRKQADKNVFPEFSEYKEFEGNDIPSDYNMSSGIVFESKDGYYQKFLIEKLEVKP